MTLRICRNKHLVTSDNAYVARDGWETVMLEMGNRLFALAVDAIMEGLTSRGIRLSEPPALSFRIATSGLRDVSNYASHPRWFAMSSSHARVRSFSNGGAP